MGSRAIAGSLLLASLALGCSSSIDDAGSKLVESAAPPLGDEPAGAPTRYPVLLLHGFNAQPGSPFAFYRVDDALRADGHRAINVALPPFNTSDRRAEYLKVAIDEALASVDVERVNIIAHSMGGLDARNVISKLGYGGKIASLTTIATPHRGSRAADFALGLIEGADDDLAARTVVDEFAKLFGPSSDQSASDTDVIGTLGSLTVRTMLEENAKLVDDPRVFYQSWAGVSSLVGVSVDVSACEDRLLTYDGRIDVMHPSLVVVAAVASRDDAGRRMVSDGLVTVESAKWGTFRGCLPADHLDQVGQPELEGANRHTGFDHQRFYRNLAYELAKKGF